jgi:hypothetical protein
VQQDLEEAIDFHTAIIAGRDGPEDVRRRESAGR